MRRDELGHFEHRDLALAAEDGLQLIVREDVPLIRRILEVVLLNVFPKFLDHLRSRERTLPDDRFKVGGEVKRL